MCGIDLIEIVLVRGLHMCASNVVFLVKAHKAVPGLKPAVRPPRWSSDFRERPVTGTQSPSPRLDAVSCGASVPLHDGGARPSRSPTRFHGDLLGASSCLRTRANRPRPQPYRPHRPALRRGELRLPQAPRRKGRRPRRRWAMASAVSPGRAEQSLARCASAKRFRSARRCSTTFMTVSSGRLLIYARPPTAISMEKMLEPLQALLDRFPAVRRCRQPEPAYRLRPTSRMRQAPEYSLRSATDRPCSWVQAGMTRRASSGATVRNPPIQL